MNVCSIYETNIWNSTELLTYTYMDIEYTNCLGNYWDDYTGSDSDNDGIGDTPYMTDIDTDRDNYPLMSRFENYIICSKNGGFLSRQCKMGSAKVKVQ